MAELADAHDSKSCSFGVSVRPRPPVSITTKNPWYIRGSFFVVKNYRKYINIDKGAGDWMGHIFAFTAAIFCAVLATKVIKRITCVYQPYLYWYGNFLARVVLISSDISLLICTLLRKTQSNSFKIFSSRNDFSSCQTLQNDGWQVLLCPQFVKCWSIFQQCFQIDYYDYYVQNYYRHYDNNKGRNKEILVNFSCI